MHPRHVLLTSWAVLDPIYQPVMRHMRESFGTKFTIVVPRDDRMSAYQPYCGPEDRVITRSDIDLFQAPAGDPFQAAGEYELRYGITYLRDIVQLDRHLSTTMFGHSPRSILGHLASADWRMTVDKINRLFAWAESFIREEGIDLVMAWPLNDLDASLACVAEHAGLLVTYPYPAKHKAILHWSYGAFAEDVYHKALFDESDDAVELVDPAKLETPPQPFAAHHRMDAAYSLPSILKGILRIALHRLEFLVLDVMAGDFSALRNRGPFLDAVVERLYAWRFYRALNKMAERDMGRLTSRPYVFYAMSQEPEFSVQGRAKEHNDQAAFMRHLALSLPSSHVLVIKEHGTLGRRELSYYSDLLRFPNVRMAHPAIRGIDLAAQAEAVATIGGTVALEAAVFGKPVLLFSTHSEMRFLPNVTVVTSFHDLPSQVRSAIARRSEGDVLAVRQAGSRFRRIVERIGFDGAPLGMFGGKEHKLPAEEAAKAADRLVELYAFFNRRKERKPDSDAIKGYA